MSLTALNYDHLFQCQDTLVQFGGFLATQLNNEDYKSKLPSLNDLHQTYHISPDVAFFLSRPLFQTAIQVRHLIFVNICSVTIFSVHIEILHQKF